MTQFNPFNHFNRASSTAPPLEPRFFNQASTNFNHATTGRRYQSCTGAARPSSPSTLVASHRSTDNAPPEPESDLSFDEMESDLVKQAPAVASPRPEPGSLDSHPEHAGRQIAALEQWLDQVHVSRTDCGA